MVDELHAASEAALSHPLSFQPMKGLPRQPLLTSTYRVHCAVDSVPDAVLNQHVVHRLLLPLLHHRASEHDAAATTPVPHGRSQTIVQSSIELDRRQGTQQSMNPAPHLPGSVRACCNASAQKGMPAYQTMSHKSPVQSRRANEDRLTSALRSHGPGLSWQLSRDKPIC